MAKFKAPHLLLRVGNVVIHHHYDLLIRNPVPVNDLVGVACVCLEEIIPLAFRYHREGGHLGVSLSCRGLPVTHSLVVMV